MEGLYYYVRQFMLLYGIPLEKWLLIMAGFLVLWTLLMISLCRRGQKEQSRNSKSLQFSFPRRRVAFALNLILMLVGLMIILLVTFVRRESVEHRVILIPLRVLFGLRVPGDYWHVTVMNIVLYVPFACGLCFVLGNKYTHPARLAVLVSFFIAFIAEVRQYILGSGWTEVDDILMNTMGAFFGTLPYLMCRKIKSMWPPA
jgi:glycopeptide antibiotics resistance protein